MWLLGFVGEKKKKKEKKSLLPPPQQQSVQVALYFPPLIPPSMTLGLSSHVMFRCGTGRTAKEQNHHKDV